MYYFYEAQHKGFKVYGETMGTTKQQVEDALSKIYTHVKIRTQRDLDKEKNK